MVYDPYNINNGDSPMPYPNGAPNENRTFELTFPPGAGMAQPNGGEEEGGFNLGGFLTNLLGGGQNGGGLLNGLLGGTNLQRLLAGYYAGNRAGDSMEAAANRYGQLGREAAAQADPWGNDRRRMFQSRLDDMLENPEKSPIFQSMNRQAMQALGPRLAAQGMSGNDAGSRDWLETIGDVSNKYMGEWADRYGKWGGADVDPGNASRFMMEGGRLEQQALQAAMAARLYPLGLLSGGQGAPNPNGGGNRTTPGGGPGGAPGIQDILRQLNQYGGQNSGAGLQQILASARMFGMNPSSLAGLWQGFPSIPGLQETYGDVGGGDWTSWFSGYGGDQPFDWESFNLDQYGVTDIGDLGFFDP